MATKNKKNSSEAEAQVKEAVNEMVPKLRRLYVRLQSQLAKNVGSNVWTKWEVGGTVLAIREDEASYGSRAVAQLSAALQISEAELHFLARFHDAFTKDRLEYWLGQKMANGSPLSDHAFPRSDGCPRG